MIFSENQIKSQNKTLSDLTADRDALLKIQAEHKLILDNSQAVKERKTVIE
jgi:hypothetical protein